ncbi:MAG: HD-GYP domain-containing protein [Telluria sp.]
MPLLSLPTAVHPHLRRHLAPWAARGQVRLRTAVTAGGKVLAAAGALLTPDLLGALAAAGPLKHPLEAALELDHGVGTGDIVSCAAGLLERNDAVARLLHAGGGPSPQALLARSTMSPALAALFSLAASEGGHGLEHAVLVSLLAACMARRLHLSEDDQHAAALAGLLHDLGELYLDPAWLGGSRRLQPQEWAQVALHPRLGQMLVNELDAFPLAVGRAVSEHHERFNGSGYPRQLTGHAISGPGQAVAVAELLAGLMTGEQGLARAELALKVIPGEHPADLVSAVSAALRAQPPAAGTAAHDDGPDAERLYWRMQAAQQAVQTLLAGGDWRKAETNALLERTLERIGTIQRAFVGTGLGGWMRHAPAPDAGLRFEQAVATREIAWRLRDLARDLALHVQPGERNIFAKVIELLDDAGAPAPESSAQAPAGVVQRPAVIAW